METEFQNAYGKSAGEVMRDIADFLSVPYLIHPKKKVDLCRMVEGLNMHEQFSFALLCEADAQGWSRDAAEGFYRKAVSGVVREEVIEAMILAFRNRDGAAFRAYDRLYGNRLSALDGSYWATVLAIGIDADQVDRVLHYLRRFTVTLMEFAYMEERNPEATYTWCYYDAFRRMLDELLAAPTPAPIPLKVRALGGSAGKRQGDAYMLSMGLDIENPNVDRMARDVRVDITLKDRNGAVITVIADKLQSVDPATVYHYGITRKIRGAAVAEIAATARADSYLSLKTPIMKHYTPSALRLLREEDGMRFHATLTSAYDRALPAPTLHYQFLSAENRILGGGSIFLMEGLPKDEPIACVSTINVPITGAAKVNCSLDFDALELVKD
ncbi:MAG: hypothetical protein IJW30_03935 [Clostridia bacterium]|nr:hypothetical protein [Clostridia bacterium]